MAQTHVGVRTVQDVCVAVGWKEVGVTSKSEYMNWGARYDVLRRRARGMSRQSE
jgi:hypothetical protein